MLSERGRRALLGIVENAEAARSFVAGMSFTEFEADRRTLYAVTRCLEIISEASRRVDDGTRTRHPHIPWRQIADAGNVYRHRYENVSPLLIWRTVEERMAEILAVCRAELAAGTQPGSRDTDTP
ncbi:HepT-like ribonuclease domain-containing protein [Methylobacterium sp. sgz302541]|uniref:HepT-like ribonuclease domain-containing protein n=1 Tax=unclassified Methylobacterium TaxID=2615210 RepID=UPI003D34C97E